MSDELAVVDPVDTSMATEDGRKAGRRRFKKLARGAPGDIRMVNKQGILSQGTRAVVFYDGELPEGLSPEEDADFSEEILEANLTESGLGVETDPEQAAAFFTAAEQLNIYFAGRANRTLAEVYPSADGSRILCFIDVFLDGEDLDDFEANVEEVTRAMEVSKRKRAEAKEAAAEAKAAQEQQDKDDLNLGRKVREHNLIEKAREADEQVKRIRRAANKLAQKHGEKGWDGEVADAP